MFIKKLTKRNVSLLLATVLILSAGLLYADPPHSPPGADAVPDLYSASLSGSGAFTTGTGGAPSSAVNPAQGADARRMIFDASYLAIPAISSLGKEAKEGNDNFFLQSISVGALFPTKYGVFGGSLRYIGGFEDDFYWYFPIERTLSGNIFASKEIYPGMSLGLGFNFGTGADWTISGDVGFRYNTGNLGTLKNFTWAVVLRALGKSYFPSWLAPSGGISFDLINVEGKDGKPDPFVLGLAGDISVPSAFYWPDISMILKAGLNVTIAEVVTLSVAWPGGSGLNLRELSDNAVKFPVVPSVGLSFNIILPSGGERIAGGRLPSDGDLKISTAFKPLYEGITAIGGGVSWYVGIADKKPPVITPDYPEPAYFSPNNDGKADNLEFPISITDENYVVSWKMEIKDEQGNVVRVIENKEQRFDSFNMKEFFSRIATTKKQIEIPSSMRWDGLRGSGDLAPDGKYLFTITATDDSGNTSVTVVYETVIKNRAPEVTVDAIPETQKIFDPKSSGARNSITFTPRGSDEEAWESGIWNASGVKVRSFENVKGRPTPRVWDGRDDSGRFAPDGVYSFRISTTDRAQNSASAELNNVILDSREAGAFLTSSVSAIKPAPNQSANLVDFTARLSLQDGIDNWKLELKDETGAVQRTFSGVSRVPAVQGWNGLNEQGRIREGIYTPELTINYTRGDVVRASATTVTVDISGPELTIVTSPEYFSPDNDGENDELIINLTARDLSPIANWSIEIRAPEAPFPVFRRIEGRGTPSSRIVWDGKSSSGELVQSAMNYPYTYTATDILGNSSSKEGRIGVDVLVIRDGDRLKIQIPSIVFRPNFADFEGLSSEVVDNNTRIIRRVAQILNQFRDYKVQVEGHANPTQPLGPARDREQVELRRISEARAKAVVDLLVRYGVARNRLTATGAGGTNPVAAYEDRDNWWKNRRVEFYLIR
jgi:outer membrane protein OmpA-like peptidoglycan-associated protein/flagellar hook assembly protein FlgD